MDAQRAVRYNSAANGRNHVFALCGAAEKKKAPKHRNHAFAKYPSHGRREAQPYGCGIGGGRVVQLRWQSVGTREGNSLQPAPAFGCGGVIRCPASVTSSGVVASIRRCAYSDSSNASKSCGNFKSVPFLTTFPLESMSVLCGIYMMP